MKKSLLLSFVLSLIFLKLNAQDFRNVKWGDSPDDVKKKETLEVLKHPSVKNGPEQLNYVLVTDTGVYFTYSYIFFQEKLIGVKVKTAYLSKGNTLYDALTFYNKCKATYTEKYKKIHEEKPTAKGCRKFKVVHKDCKLYVEIKEENSEYFIVETIMKSNAHHQ